MLSDMQTTLKSWVPKFQKALSGQQPVRSNENKPDQSIDQTAVYVPKDDAIKSPKPTKWESLLSLSPLVSWRAECNIEGGRHLFLLTPLPQPKSFSSKLEATSAAVPECELTKPPANHVPENRPMFVMTPCLKMSPPKSCMLLEPVSAFSGKKKQGVDVHAPSPAVVQKPDSLGPESSSSRSLNVKYPELLGIKLNSLVNKVEAEESPDWLVSPLKSCATMEPLDEKLLNNTAGDCLTAIAEHTPVMKAATSTARMGRRDPRENTIKRELWMKFEAASVVNVNHCILQNVTKKGFLDRLEEEASEE